jgi:hypothetical protein
LHSRIPKPQSDGKRLAGVGLLLLSLGCGLAITVALLFISNLTIRLFPYRDLPMMPKPFFLYALAPGIIAGEVLAHGWIQGFVFFLTNSVVYAVAAFCVIAAIDARSSRE